MDFTRIKNLVRGNGEKLILVENGEPEVVVMSFSEYTRLMGAGMGSAASTVNATPMGTASMSAHSPALSAHTRAEAGHATEEQFEMPLHGENHEPEFYPALSESSISLGAEMSQYDKESFPQDSMLGGKDGIYGESEPEPMFDESPLPLAHDMSLRLANIRLEDLPI